MLFSTKILCGGRGSFKTQRKRDLPEGTQQVHGKAGFEFMAPNFYFSAIPLAQNFPLLPYYRISCLGMRLGKLKTAGIEFTGANKRK